MLNDDSGERIDFTFITIIKFTVSNIRIIFPLLISLLCFMNKNCTSHPYFQREWGNLFHRSMYLISFGWWLTLVHYFSLSPIFFNNYLSGGVENTLTFPHFHVQTNLIGPPNVIHVVSVESKAENFENALQNVVTLRTHQGC